MSQSNEIPTNDQRTESHDPDKRMIRFGVKDSYRWINYKAGSPMDMFLKKEAAGKIKCRTKEEQLKMTAAYFLNGTTLRRSEMDISKKSTKFNFPLTDKLPVDEAPTTSMMNNENAGDLNKKPKQRNIRTRQINFKFLTNVTPQLKIKAPLTSTSVKKQCEKQPTSVSTEGQNNLTPVEEQSTNKILDQQITSMETENQSIPTPTEYQINQNETIEEAQTSQNETIEEAQTSQNETIEELSTSMPIEKAQTSQNKIIVPTPLLVESKKSKKSRSSLVSAYELKQLLTPFGNNCSPQQPNFSNLKNEDMVDRVKLRRASMLAIQQSRNSNASNVSGSKRSLPISDLERLLSQTNLTAHPFKLDAKILEKASRSTRRLSQPSKNQEHDENTFFH